MPHADLDGCRIWYELKGSGEYLLQIPGMFFAHDNFGLVSDAMARHFTVIPHAEGVFAPILPVSRVC